MRHRFPVIRQVLAACVIALALLAPEAAIAAATPVSPPSGAVVDTSSPEFTWGLPSNEVSDGISLADASETTADGRFVEANIVTSARFSQNETSWSPSSPLPAGTYWWNVQTHDPATSAVFYSTPSSFSIPARARVNSIKVRRFTFIDSLGIIVSYTANTDSARITVRLRRGSRTVWSKTQTDNSLAIGRPTTALFAYKSRGRIPEGTRLRLTVTVQAGDARATKTRRVRAP